MSTTDKPKRVSHVLLSPNHAGQILGLTTSGVIKMARRGELLDLRDSSGRRFFFREDVERVAAARAAAKAAK